MIKKAITGLFAVGLLGMAQFAAHAEVVWSWTIDKTADQTDFVVPEGQVVLVNYTVTVFGTPTGEGDPITDECVDLFDTNVGGLLATRCEVNVGPSSYILTFGEVGSGADIEGVPGINTHTNTASFITIDTGNDGSDSWTVRFTIEDIVAVAEPAPLALIGIALVAFAFSRRKTLVAKHA